MGLALPADRTRVRRHLGHSDRFVNTDSDLDQAMNAVVSNPDTDALIVVLLDKCDAMHAEIEENVRIISLATNVGSIQLRGAYQLAILRSEGRGYTAQISNLLGIPLRNGGSFGTSGSPSSGSGHDGGNLLPYG